ncbi:DMT family transporter [Flavimarina sp. Hel_I_48]|uniref:DMT family transporter n=1 Tax=Flavimarina sp. Hel_I_48 TaxID=1392488 RepID=UPI000692353A|nr:DMT family transporter [Flavimarina sp. Hel_I_48]
MTKKAIYAVILCALIAGTNGILIKYMTSLSTGTMGWFRAIVPLLFVLPTLYRKNELKFKGNYKTLLLASLINAGRMYLYLIAFTYTSIGNAVVLFYTYPLFVAAIESIYLKQPIPRKQLLFLLMAFLGIIVAYAGKSFSFESDDFVGMLAALGSAVGYAITVILFKTEAQNFSKNQLIFYQNIAGAVVFLPFLAGIGSAEIDHLGVGVLYGFVIGIGVFKLFFFGLKYLPAATATSLMYLEVVSAIALGYFILDETLTLNMILGGALIVIGSWSISRLKRREQVNNAALTGKND